jgi:WD40 repeat protein
MPHHLRCPQGHHWELAADGPASNGAVCPVCGAAADNCGSSPATEMLAPSAVTGTVSGPATSSLAAPAREQVPPELAEHTRYRVLGLLGQGGMGAVYKAEHRLMERTVALKVITSGLMDDPAAITRFRREVKAAARLSHPNIVQAHDADQAGDLHFLVMEHVEGTDLARLVAERGPLPVAEACEYTRQAALGLQHAFEHGMVHRDIKPHNLMRTPDGQIKVLDFGLSRFVSESAPAGAAEAEPAEQTKDILPEPGSPLTQTGALMGTMDYIAPEQTRDAHTADIRADIYSLGCTLYFLLAGHCPFPEGSFADKLLAHRQRQPRPLTELRKDLPPPLLRVLERMTAKEPAQRYQTPAEVADALTPFTRRPGRRWGALVAALLLLTVLGVAGYHYGPTIFRFVTDKGQLLLESEDPDARVIVHRDGTPDRSLNLQEARRLELPAGEYQIEMAEGQPGWQATPSAFTVRRGRQAVVAVLPDQVRTFKGHTGGVWSVAFSPDGQQILSTSADGTMRLWDTATGKVLRVFQGHTAGLFDAAFSPDGRLALSCASNPDNTLRLWDVATGAELRRFERHTNSVRKVAFAPDGRQVLSGSWDFTVRLWDAATGQPVRPMLAHANLVEGVAFSPQGDRALSCSTDGTIRLWDLATGQFRPFRAHFGAPMRAVYSPDGRRILSGGGDGIVRLWDATTGETLRSFDGHTGRVESVAFSPDGRLALSCGGTGDGTVRLWDVERGQELYRFEGHLSGVNCVVFSPDGRCALTASLDRTVRLWRLPDAERLRRLSATLPFVESRTPLRVFEGHTGVVRSVALSLDGRYALSASGTSEGDKTVRLWDVADGRELRHFQGHTQPVQCAVFSPDGRQALSGSRDRTLRLWDVATGRELKVFRGHTHVVNTVAFSPDGRRALSGGFDRTLRLWDVAGGQELYCFQGHTNWVIEAIFSPDGRRILSAGHDNTVRLWDVDSGEEVHCFRGHTRPVECLAFSPDGRRALSGAQDAAIRMWDLESGEGLGIFIKQRDTVAGLAFSPDGRRILSACHDGTIRLWDAESRREICRFEGHTRGVWGAVFSPDERHILSGSADQTLRWWEVPP